MSDEPGREASSVLFDRWMGKAAENIDEWGLQAEETLLLAIQEEVGELAQAHLEARAEGGDPERIDEELEDLGALLIQLHERRQQDGRTCVYCGKGDDAYGDSTAWYRRTSDDADAHRRCSPRP